MPEQAKIVPPEPDGFLPLLLKDFQAPDAPFQPDGEWESVYRLFLIGILDAPQYREWRCHPAGALRLSRKPRPDGNFVLQVEFMAHQSLEAHARSFDYMQAEILCADDDASSLLRWRRLSMQLTPKGEPIEGTKLEINGEVTPNGLVLRYAGRERKIKTPLPITCDWAIFDLVQRLSQRLGEQRLRPSEPKPLLEFALLEDLEFLRTNHRIFLSEPLEGAGDTGQGTWNVEVDGKRFRWRRFVQFGDGVLTWAYCLDEQHHLVLAYSGMRAYLYDPTAESAFPFGRDKGHGARDMGGERVD